VVIDFDATPSSDVMRAAERLRLAGSMHRVCPPVREFISEEDVDAAYAVQQHVVTLQEISGAEVVGRKLGMMSPAVQRQLGVNEATIGTLMDTMQVRHDGVIPVRRLLQPLIEAELVFRLGEDLDAPDVDEGRARSAVSEILAALEVVDSRIAGWDITRVDTIADNASAGLFVLAPEGRPIDGHDLRTLRMEMRRDGELVSSGSGADNVMGDPLSGLAWLAREAHRRGVGLRAGQVVFAGALGPMVPIREGDTFAARIGDLPEVRVKIRSSAAARVAEAGA
jgi:2-keto-4-pentenoate hydratase